MSNPVLSEERWSQLRDVSNVGSNVMTVDGTVTKTGFLLVILLATVGLMWNAFWNGGAIDMKAVMPWLIGGSIGGLILALVGMFAPRWAMLTGTLYAVAQGLVIGGLTMFFESMPAYHGLALTAAAFTAATLIGMLILYRTGIIKATPGLIKGIIMATAGLMLGIGILFLLNLFGIGGGIVATLYGNGPIGIGFSVLCVGLAAFNLIVDFHVIEEGAKHNAPKYMEWVGAFGLLVTLVWLYIEILRLLAKLRSR
ncbi:MAG: Bax inhibitor-1/YccA family protein [Planctomycetota bacterium]